MKKNVLGVLICCLAVSFSLKETWGADETITINTNQSLTDNIKDNAPEEFQEFELPKPGKNWINQLIGTAQEKVGFGNSKKQEETRVQTNKRANASVFNIAGVMLRMSYQQAEDALQHRGYRRTSQKLDIPNFLRWRGEDKCRRQGVIGYERLENCVIKLAQKEGHHFISEAIFNKYDTQESVHIYLTSTFSGNKIYKIEYQTEAANVTGNSAKARYLRNIKVYDFWKKINQKYGVPDNKEDVIWGLGGNQPYMKGQTGRLLLEDPTLRELDFNRMMREDQRIINTDVYTF